MFGKREEPGRAAKSLRRYQVRQRWPTKSYHPSSSGQKTLGAPCLCPLCANIRFLTALGSIPPHLTPFSLPNYIAHPVGVTESPAIPVRKHGRTLSDA